LHVDRRWSRHSFPRRNAPSVLPRCQPRRSKRASLHPSRRGQHAGGPRQQLQRVRFTWAYQLSITDEEPSHGNCEEEARRQEGDEESSQESCCEEGSEEGRQEGDRQEGSEEGCQEDHCPQGRQEGDGEEGSEKGSEEDGEEGRK